VPWQSAGSDNIRHPPSRYTLPAAPHRPSAVLPSPPALCTPAGAAQHSTHQAAGNRSQCGLLDTRRYAFKFGTVPTPAANQQAQGRVSVLAKMKQGSASPHGGTESCPLIEVSEGYKRNKGSLCSLTLRASSRAFCSVSDMLATLACSCATCSARPCRHRSWAQHTAQRDEQETAKARATGQFAKQHRR
jgi:hypothetical protein